MRREEEKNNKVKFLWRTDRAAEKKLLVSPVTTLLDP